MNELTNTTGNTNLSRLDTLAVEANGYSNAIAFNAMQLGRVFCEAKTLVKHGEWSEWVEKNTQLSERSAQNIMAIYTRYGNKQAFQGIEKSKLFSMIALPEGTEEKFLQEHDVKSMTSREVQQAVKKAREEERRKTEAEWQKKLDEEQKNTKKAVRELQALKNKPVTMDEAHQTAIKQMKQATDNIMQEKNDLTEENNKLTRQLENLKSDLNESNEYLENSQQENKKLKKQILDMQSAMAKGDAEREPVDTLTLSDFSKAVSAFIGTCARMPYTDFTDFSPQERKEYRDLLNTVIGWCDGVDNAMNTFNAKAVIV